jgi:hypothetical protein
MTPNAKTRVGALCWLGIVGLVGCAASGPGDGGGGGGGGGDADGGGSTIGDVDILPENMLDNLDDGDSAIPEVSGRIGAWYTYNDETAAGSQVPAMGDAFEPVAGGPGTSVFFANTSGSGFAVWGAGFGLDLNNDDVQKQSYDASAFTGIRLKAKGSVPVRASVMVAGVISSAVGGSCEPGAGAGQGCDDGHGRVLVLSGTWETYELPFAQLTQAGWGKVVAFDATAVMSVQFNVDKNLAFDVAVDDIGFY